MGECQPPFLPRTPNLPSRPPCESCGARDCSQLHAPQFNLESEELLTVRDELEGWRQDIAQPLHLDIYLETAANSLMREAVGATAGEPSVVLLERWHVQYAPLPTPPAQVAWPGFYKRHMVLLRSILGQLRMMPSHRSAGGKGPPVVPRPRPACSSRPLGWLGVGSRA